MQPSYLRLVLDLVGGLLELADLSYDVGNLSRERKKLLFTVLPSALPPHPGTSGALSHRPACVLPPQHRSGAARSPSHPSGAQNHRSHSLAQRGHSTHHPHFGEVHQPVLGVIRGPLLYEGQVGQVHPQVGDTRRVAASGANRKQTREKTSLLGACLGSGGEGEGPGPAEVRV